MLRGNHSARGVKKRGVKITGDDREIEKKKVKLLIK